MMTDSEIKQRLEKANRLVATLTENLKKAEAIRDSLVRQLCDVEGAHDRHPVAVR